jgi:proteic killer suppression protein
VFKGENTGNARKSCPETLRRIAVRKLDQLDSVTGLTESSIPLGNRLEILSGDRGRQMGFIFCPKG